MSLIDKQYMETPFYGSIRFTEWLKSQGYSVNRKRIQRLMRQMGIAAICPRKRTTVPGSGHKIYPYLLRDFKVDRPNQVWSSDITYVKLESGFMYLTAVIDWYSRYVISWELSNTLENSFCIHALKVALRLGIPEIFNSDQGVQYTAKSFTQVLIDHSIRISMDGKGRALDNIFIERLWRSVKYENIYMNCYSDVPTLFHGLSKYFTFYNRERLHQSLSYKTPYQVHFASQS